MKNEKKCLLIPKMTPLNVFFCPQAKNIQSTVIEE